MQEPNSSVSSVSFNSLYPIHAKLSASDFTARCFLFQPGVEVHNPGSVNTEA